MNLAPADSARRKRMRNAAVSCVQHGEGFFVVGFDWQPHYAAFDLREADEILDGLSDRCNRAIVRVKKSEKGFFQTAIVEVGGDDHVFAFNVSLDHPNLSRWSNPDELLALEVQYLRRV